MNREAIYQALFDLVAAAPGLVTTSRKLKHWADVPANERPALFMTQVSETASNTTGIPTKWTLAVRLYVYISTEDWESPGSALNPILDYIADTLDIHPARGPQTLGGLVHWARIEGTIETAEGVLGNDEVAIIPVMILTA